MKPRPFTRFVAIGDSFTEGLFDPKPDQTNAYVGWADRLAGHLARCASEDDRSFGYANLAVRGRLLDNIAGQQVDDALALEPDLVSIVGGGTTSSGQRPTSTRWPPSSSMRWVGCARQGPTSCSPPRWIPVTLH